MNINKIDNNIINYLEENSSNIRKNKINNTKNINYISKKEKIKNLIENNNYKIYIKKTAISMSKYFIK